MGGGDFQGFFELAADFFPSRLLLSSRNMLTETQKIVLAVAR